MYRHEHAFFGEQSFFARTAAATTVKAGTYCELMLLSYDAFTQIAAHFPDLEEHMRRCRGELAARQVALRALKSRDSAASHLHNPRSEAAHRTNTHARTTMVHRHPSRTADSTQ